MPHFTVGNHLINNGPY